MPTSWEKDSGKENARELAQASTRRSSDRRTAVKPAARSEFSCQQSTRSLAFQLARRTAFSLSVPSRSLVSSLSSSFPRGFSFPLVISLYLSLFISLSLFFLSILHPPSRDSAFRDMTG